MTGPAPEILADALRVVRAHALDELPFCRDSLRGEERFGDAIADHPDVIRAIQERRADLLSRQVAMISRRPRR